MHVEEQKLVHQFLEMNAKERPGKLGYIQKERRLTYRQLNSLANQVAIWLTQYVGTRGRVLLLLENSVQYVVSYYGALKAGFIAVPVNCDMPYDSLVEIVQQLEPDVMIACRRSEMAVKKLCLNGIGGKHIVCDNPSLSWHETGKDVSDLRNLLDYGHVQESGPTVPIQDEDLSTIVFTSGSTGKPKGVMLSHANIVSNTLSITKYLQLTEDDIQMVVLPFHYVMGKSLEHPLRRRRYRCRQQWVCLSCMCCRRDGRRGGHRVFRCALHLCLPFAPLSTHGFSRETSVIALLQSSRRAHAEGDEGEAATSSSVSYAVVRDVRCYRSRCTTCLCRACKGIEKDRFNRSTDTRGDHQHIG